MKRQKTTLRSTSRNRHNASFKPATIMKWTILLIALAGALRVLAIELMATVAAVTHVLAAS